MGRRGTNSYSCAPGEYVPHKACVRFDFMVLIVKLLKTTQMFIFMKMDNVWHIHRVE